MSQTSTAVLTAWLAMMCAGTGSLHGCAALRGDACSTDADCEIGTACREATCHKPCPGNHWVGERVGVVAGTDTKHAEIVACDLLRHWVRYESGIEERVDKTRLSKPRAKK